MSSPALLALMLGPLSVYFYLLGVWHSGRHPRVVGGAADLALLAFGLGGFLVFGPVGGAVASLVFGATDLFGRLALASLLALVVALRAPRAGRRLVIYNIGPEALDRAVREALADVPGAFARTLHGYEDAAGGRALVVEAGPRTRTGVVEATGRGAEDLIRRVGPALRARLARVEVPASAVPWVLIGLSLALVLPVLGVLLSNPRTAAALRALLQRLQGG